MKNIYLFLFSCFLFSTTHLQAQCIAEAGENKLICGFDCVELGGVFATEATFEWTPSEPLNDASAQYPVACVEETTTFYLTVTDSSGCVATDSVMVFSYESPVADAGPAFELTEGDTIIVLDGSESTPGAQYSWVASEGGNIVYGADTPYPGVNSVGLYTLTVSIGECSETDLTIVTADESITLICAEDMMAFCNEIPEPDTPTVVNYCNSAYLLLLHETIEEGECANSYTIIRNWTASNGCNEATECTQTITVIDDETPEFINFENQISVECGTPEIIFPEVEDNCSSITEIELIYQDSILSDHPCDAYTIRTWIATDECGNEAREEQHIFSYDITPPVFTFVPEDIIMECGFDTDSTDLVIVAEAEDNCGGNVEINYSDEIISDNPCHIMIRRNWVAIDFCGNSTLAIQTIEKIDTIAPVFTFVPEDTNMGCSLNDSEDDHPDGGEEDNEDDHHDILFAEAEDNCDNPVFIDYVDHIISDSACHFVIERVWRAADHCGNQTTAIQMINTIDSLPPVFHEVPADLTLSCGEADSYLSDSTEVFVTDNCSFGLEMDYTEEFESTDNCSQLVTRHWYATDDCGNSAIATQIITIVDFAAPVFSQVDGVIELNCGDELPPVPEVTVEDNCDPNIEIVFNQYVETEDSTACHKVIVREWTAVDACQNTARVFQEIIIRDQQAPVFVTMPEDVTVECDDLSNINSLVEVTDQCSEVEIDFAESTIAGDCPNNYQIVKTWMATDACGNVSDYQQIITVEDHVSPTIVGIPEDLTLECGENIPSVENVEASDNCGEGLDLSMEVTQSGTTCPYTIIRTWTAVDACGNETIDNQIITIGEPAVDCPDIFLSAEMVVGLNESPGEACLPVFGTTAANFTILLDGFNTTYTTDCDPTQASIQLVIEEGTHQIIAINEAGCRDTLVLVAELNCPPLVEPFVIQTNTFCDEPLKVCLETVSIDNLEECYLLLNDNEYDGYLGICAGTNDNIEVELPVGEHELVFYDVATNCVKATYEIFIASDNSGCDELEISLRKGWNIISSYVMPNPANVAQVFAPIADEVVLVKNDLGDIHVPSFNINTIGDWSIEKGYKIKTTQNTVLTITGTKVNPETTSVSIRSGWQMIAYLRDTPRDVLTELAHVADDIFIIKGAMGGVAIPSFGINNLGDLEPGKGYKVKGSNNTSFFYSANTPFTGQTVDERNEDLKYFTQPIDNTGNNATIVFLTETVNEVLMEEDEIGIFTQDGILCGAGVYTGNHFAITIWGDDTSTENEKEGFSENEPYLIRLWNHQTNTLSDLHVTYLEGNNLYQEDAIAIPATVSPTIIIEQPNAPLANHISMESTPNPASEVMTIHLQLPTDTDCAIQLIDMSGRILAVPFSGQLNKGHHQLEVFLQDIPAGVYWYQLQTGEGVLAKKIVVTK